jgi:hypothetical protein
VEATLAMQGIDIRDRWVRDEHGRRKLTLAMIAVRLRYLAIMHPVNPISIAENGGRLPYLPPTRMELIVADVFQAIAHERSPRIPDPSAIPRPATSSSSNSPKPSVSERDRLIAERSESARSRSVEQ